MNWLFWGQKLYALKNLWAAANSRELPNISYHHWIRNIRFERLIFEESQKYSKKRWKKNQKFDYAEGHKLKCKKIWAQLLMEWSLTKNGALLMERKRKKIKNIGQLFPSHFFECCRQID